MVDPATWNFGQVEAACAELHSIDATKRTAFQSRVKNFHRLGFPPDFSATKGKAARYSAHQVYMIGLALELTQLGLTPDRVVRVLIKNQFPVVQAARMAARALTEWHERREGGEAAPLQMYLYFDPAALQSLTTANAVGANDVDEASETFFYGGHGVMNEMLSRFSPGGATRLCLVNVTTMLFGLDEKLDGRMLEPLLAWADKDETLDNITITKRNAENLARLAGVTPELLREGLRLVAEHDNDPEA